MKKMELIKKTLATVLILALLGAVQRGPVHAATRLTEEFAEMLRLSDAVVDVQVLTRETRAAGEDEVPLTIVTLRIEKVYKGTLAAGAEIQVETFGGADGEEQFVVPGQARLLPETRAELLLSLVNGHWRVLGGDAGQVNLAQSSDGQIWAQRMTGQFEYFETDPASITGYNRVSARQMRAETLAQLTRAILEKGQPVLGAHAEEAKPLASVAAPPVVIAAPPPQSKAAEVSIRFVLLAGLVLATGFLALALSASRRYTTY